jgi:hypothetical protein
MTGVKFLIICIILLILGIFFSTMILSLISSRFVVCDTHPLLDSVVRNPIVNPPPPKDKDEYSGDTTPWVLFFNETNFQGVYAGLKPGQSMPYGLYEGWKKSVRIPPAHELILFKENELKGERHYLEGDVPDLVNVFKQTFDPKSFLYHLKDDRNIFPRIYESPSFRGKETLVQYGVTELSDSQLYIGSLKIPKGMRLRVTFLNKILLKGVTFVYKETRTFTDDAKYVPFTYNRIVRFDLKTI